MQEKKVGEYRITTQILGSGAFSTVYTSYNRNYQKLAVKVIPRQNIRENQLPFFQRQINILKKCNNQRIVEFIDVKKTKSNFYIFLQYCEGGNLLEYISQHHNRRLPEIEALRIFGQLVRGMSCLKSMNIIHRDLKPSNIMLKNGNIKIVDFGLARKFFNGELLKTYAGSPLNMAPEIHKAQPYTDKIDIYSAGTILYQMLYGVCPFEACCREDLIKSIDQGVFIDNEQINISDKVVAVLKGMLQPSPVKRLQLSDLIDFVQTYEKQQQQEKIKQLKKLVLSSSKHYGVFGSIIYPFMEMNNSKNSYFCDSPSNLDLRIAGKYIKEISSC